jgi:peptidoglycan hydrolase-like amidase
MSVMSCLRRRLTPVALGLLLMGGAAVPGASPAAAAVPPAPGPNIVISGSGWGHSVGMSQYGARAMAQAGRSAAQILAHYYSGTSVRTDVGTGEDGEVAVDLFRNRVPADATRLFLQAKGRAGGTPTTGVGVRLGSPPNHSDVPLSTTEAYNISFDGGFVLRNAAGNELGRSSTISTYLNPPAGDNPALLAFPQLGATGDPANRAGTYSYGEVTVTFDGTRMIPVLRQQMRTYLYGIAEVPSSWEPAALDAQAITARTYAARRSNAVLSATPADQAYAGWAKEGEPSFGVRWVDAVNRTSGQKVVAPDGSLAQTFYSSSHGLGRSEASQDSWAYSSEFSYLKSVDDPWSAGGGNPFASWTAEASNPAFAAAIGLARVNSIRIASRTGGGSPKAIVVDGWTPGGDRITCTWAGGEPCPANDGGAKGAGAKLRTTLDLVVGGAGGRLRSQQISSFTIVPFTDDEDSVHQFNIGAVAQAGITQGCTTTTYCPKGAVTRGQMAAFLARALKLPAYSGPDRFNDVAGSPQRASINALAAAGRIGGFPDGSYRPFAPVSREQMATFLARAFDVPAASGNDRFTDIGASVHRARINDVAARGLTGGCTATTYCPSAQVTREQMASFLARAIGAGS